MASYRCPDLERALEIAADIGGLVGLEADVAAPAHASEIYAVLLGLESESAMRSGWYELDRRVQTAGRRWTGAILQRLVESGADFNEFANATQLGLYCAVLNEIPRRAASPPRSRRDIVVDPAPGSDAEPSTEPKVT